jgi:hypothetical protein
MPVLMSHSQALKMAAQLRRTRPGLVRVGVLSGALYVEQKPDGEKWTDVWRDEAPSLSAPMDTLDGWQTWVEAVGAQR